MKVDLRELESSLERSTRSDSLWPHGRIWYSKVKQKRGKEPFSRFKSAQKFVTFLCSSGFSASTASFPNIGLRFLTSHILCFYSGLVSKYSLTSISQVGTEGSFLFLFSRWSCAKWSIYNGYSMYNRILRRAIGYVKVKPVPESWIEIETSIYCKCVFIRYISSSE